MKKKTISELNQEFKDAESCDQDLFAEQRSNLLLVSGNHHTKKSSAFWNRIRDEKALSSDQKLKLTKNHIYKISKIRKNIILSHASGVKVFPNNENELQDQKAAELNQAVWTAIKAKQNWRKKVNNFSSDFFDIGEVAAKIYFDPTKGELVGYEQELDENGQPAFNEDGTPKSSGRGIFKGELTIERILAFNLLRDPNAKTIEESPYLIYRKAISHAQALAFVKGDEEKEKMLAGQKDDTFFIFDTNKNKYQKDKNVVTLREHYYRPCPDYPDGYFYITTEAGILFEGPLPYGIFPIVYEGHDEIPTTPRHHSPLKQLRPWQIEINRAASKIAEHQITLGDDKIITQSGAKVTSGAVLPGVRSIQVSGMKPEIMPGRSGDQYFAYLEGQISELYQAAMIPEDSEEKGDQDAWASLFKSLRHKKKFIIDAEKFGGFLTKVSETTLQLAKCYLDDDDLIPMVGRSEVVNIPEFKNSSPLCYQIKVEESSDDMETQMGKQLMLNHILQFSSAQLSKEDIGRLIRAMPVGNNEEAFKDLTMNYDRATNIILALDRGQSITPNKYDDGPYVIKRLTTRMSQSDFETLDEAIKQNYENLVNLYEEMETEKARQLKAMQDDFIPTDGAMIKVAWYIKDPTNSARSVQATLPASSIEWLVKRLEDQGSAQKTMQGLGQAAPELASHFNEQSGVSPTSGEQQTPVAPESPVTPRKALLNKLEGVLQ